MNRAVAVGVGRVSQVASVAGRHSKASTVASRKIRITGPAERPTVRKILRWWKAVTVVPGELITQTSTDCAVGCVVSNVIGVRNNPAVPMFPTAPESFPRWLIVLLRSFRLLGR